MEKTKRVTKNASVSIPKDMRLEAGIYPGMAIDIKSDGASLTITPHSPTCRFCGCTQDVVKVNAIDMEICLVCAAKIVEAVNEGDR